MANKSYHPKNYREHVLPIKDPRTLRDVELALLHGTEHSERYHRRNGELYGRRNYTIFQVGKDTMLRVSDVLKLKMNDVYTSDGRVRRNTITKDKKTGKLNSLYLKPCRDALAKYLTWRHKHNVTSKWLFPSTTNQPRYKGHHISTTQFYRIMRDVGLWLDLDYLGTHTMRKTGAYLVYKHTGDIALVMKLLNQSSQDVTLRYLGLTNQHVTNVLDGVDFR